MKHAWFASLIFALMTWPLHASPVEDCRRLLVSRANNAAFAAWNRIPALLAQVEKSTILVRLDMDKALPRLGYLVELSNEAPGLAVPDALRVVNSNSLLFVAHGTTEALEELHDRIAGSEAASAASFYVIDSSRVREPLTFPTEYVPLGKNGDVRAVDESIKGKLAAGKAFSIYNIDARQPVFLIPRAQVAAFDKDLLAHEKIVITSSTRAPGSMAAWLLSRSQAFSKRSILYIGSWAVVSARAFQTLHELSRTMAEAPGYPNVDETFAQALSRCYGFSCSLTPVAESDEESEENGTAAMDDGSWNGAGRRHIVSLLKAKRLGITGPNGIELGFLALDQLVPDEKAAEDYRHKIRAVGFQASEYNIPSSSQRARVRFAQAWRAFLVAVGSPYSDKPLTASNIRKAISLLED